MMCGFTYGAAPTVTGLCLSCGAAEGGTDSFPTRRSSDLGATVTFGGTGATNVVVVSASQITATTPAHAAGGVNVERKSTRPNSSHANNSYADFSAKKKTGVSPSSGTTAGGTAVTVTVTDF